MLYDATVRGRGYSTKSLYKGKHKLSRTSSPRHIVLQRYGEIVKLFTFSQYSLRGTKLTMKHVRESKLSPLEKNLIDEILKRSGL